MVSKIWSNFENTIRNFANYVERLKLFFLQILEDEIWRKNVCFTKLVEELENFNNWKPKNCLPVELLYHYMYEIWHFVSADFKSAYIFIQLS